jgi:hypothetical protein
LLASSLVDRGFEPRLCHQQKKEYKIGIRVLIWYAAHGCVTIHDLRLHQEAHKLFTCYYTILLHYALSNWFLSTGPRGRRDRMVVGFTTIYAISAYHHLSCEFEPRSEEVYSIQHYVIKFISDLRPVGGFFRVLRFSPSIKLTATMNFHSDRCISPGTQIESSYLCFYNVSVSELIKLYNVMILPLTRVQICSVGLGSWCLTPLLTIFQL